MTSRLFEDIRSTLDTLQATLEGPIVTPTEKEDGKVVDELIPISKVIGPYCSKATLYRYVNEGRVVLYKFGRKRFVKANEFFSAFKVVNPKTLENYDAKEGGANEWK